MKTLYNIFISLLVFGMKIGAAFNYKMRRGLAGRRQSCVIVNTKFSKEDKVIWMHAASLGEYEQGLPVLEKLKEEYPSHKILITFFSPSGYEVVVKKKHIADAVCYLPFDLERWISEFTSHFKTDIFFTVKYDYWYNLLADLKAKGAKVYVISALFYEKQVFFKPYGTWFKKQLMRNVGWFFHQTDHSYALAKTIGLNQSSIAGDTRYDRVRQIRERIKDVNYINDFKCAKKLIVFGSSWEAEEKMAEIVSIKASDVKIILAPHDLKRVDFLEQIFPDALLYSDVLKSLDPQMLKLKNGEEDFTTSVTVTPTSLAASQILIIDSIGLLSKLYAYADVAVVGGGFHSAGLHNILEAATFGVPVIFGNHYQKNPEADALINAEGAKSFSDEHSASDFILKMLSDDLLLKQWGGNAYSFINSQPNSTKIILEKIVSENKCYPNSEKN